MMFNILIVGVLAVGLAAASCPYPDAPKHSHVAFSDQKLTEGTVASYECGWGLDLLGPPRRHCVGGKWMPDGIPFCVPERMPITPVLHAICSNATHKLKPDIASMLKERIIWKAAECFSPITDWMEWKGADFQSKGSFNELAKRYCAMTLKLKKCLESIGEEVKPCIGDAGIRFIDELLEQLDEFICSNDGERLAGFLASNLGAPNPTDFKLIIDDICHKTLKLVQDINKMNPEKQNGLYDEYSNLVVSVFKPDLTAMVKELLGRLRKPISKISGVAPSSQARSYSFFMGGFWLITAVLITW